MSNIDVIAEVGNSHEGSLGLAHQFIEAVSTTGATTIKFQTHIASAESTPEEPFRVHFSYEDQTRFDYWKRLEFTKEQWAGLKKHAEDKGLRFLSTPFSIEAVELLERIGVTGYKIGSGETGFVSLIDRIIETGKPVYLSSGMSSLSEIDQTVSRLKKGNIEFTLFQCTTQYPTPPERIGLNLIHEFQSRYQCPVGLSDHSGTIFPSLSAVTLGAVAIEVHVTLSPHLFGPDVVASIQVEELKKLVEGVRFVEKALQNPVCKDKSSNTLKDIKKLFAKSAVSVRPLEKGEAIELGDFRFKKPGTGLSEIDLKKMIGKKLNRPLPQGEILRKEDVQF